MILALAFVRSDDITSFADALKDDLDEDETVVEDTYIGRMSRRGNGRRLPQFPHSLWNVHDRVLLQQDKKNTLLRLHTESYSTNWACVTRRSGGSLMNFEKCKKDEIFNLNMLSMDKNQRKS